MIKERDFSDAFDSNQALRQDLQTARVNAEVNLWSSGAYDKLADEEKRLLERTMEGEIKV